MKKESATSKINPSATWGGLKTQPGHCERSGFFASYKFCPNPEVSTILGLLAIILLQVTSSMRDYKMLEEWIRWVQRDQGQNVDVPKRKVTLTK